MKRNTSLKVLILLMAIVFCAQISKPANAGSEAACAIWICLPGGFPTGCSAAYGEFKDRIKHGRDPLPALSGCSTGPNGETVSGRYQLGYELWEPCKDDYVIREYRQSGSYRANQASCFLETCAPTGNVRGENSSCENYAAVRRPKPSYVQMWVDGSYLGQFFY